MSSNDGLESDTTQIKFSPFSLIFFFFPMSNKNKLKILSFSLLICLFSNKGVLLLMSKITTIEL